MKLLSYFRDRWKIMLLLAVCLGAYTVVLCLYRTDGEALEYGLLVAGLVILIGFLVDFLRYRRRFDNLKQAKAQLPYEPPAGKNGNTSSCSKLCLRSTASWTTPVKPPGGKPRITIPCGSTRSRCPLPPWTCCSKPTPDRTPRLCRGNCSRCGGMWRWC